MITFSRTSKLRLGRWSLLAVGWLMVHGVPLCRAESPDSVAQQRTGAKFAAAGWGSSGRPMTEKPDLWLAKRPHRFSARHIGIGRPLEGTSWRNRPWSVGCFAGQWFGDGLKNDLVEQQDGFFGGYRFGYDMAHYWGTELRLSLSYIDVSYLPDRTDGGSTRNVVGDVNLLYYPWGDSRWRPFASLGIGLAGFHFIGPNNVAVDRTMFQIPIGGGVKYLLRHWCALRLDLKDNLAIGGGDTGALNNWSVTGGVEVHWGGASSQRYYPW